MKKIVFALLSIFLLLASCATPKNSTAIPITPTVLQPAEEKLSFDSLDMSDANTGWGIDILGRIFHTADGGDTWTPASPPDGVYTSGGFFALDGNTAWAAKDVPVRCWDYLSIYECHQPYYAAVKDGSVWKTTNGGKTWQPSESFPLNVEKAPYSFDGALPFSPIGLQFLDPQTGWLLAAVGQTPAGEQSLLYRTSDGGTTWDLVQTFGFESTVYSCHKRGFTFSDELSGWLVADCPNQESNTILTTAFRTVDGGKTWSTDSQVLEPPSLAEVQAVHGQGSAIALPDLTGGVRSQRYPDGSLGVHLRRYDLDAYDYYDLYVYGAIMFVRYGSGLNASSWLSWTTMDSEFFLDADHGWRLYWNISTRERWLQRTVNGGQTWETYKTVDWTTARFEFVDTQNGWAIATGQAGLPSLVKTTDGGQTWELLAAHTGGKTPAENNPSTGAIQNLQPVSMEAFWMIDNSVGWAVTTEAQVIRTIDGAQTWRAVTPPVDANVCLTPDGFFALDANTAWVSPQGCSAGSAQVWRTTDGGRTWAAAVLELPESIGGCSGPFFLPRLDFINAKEGWIVAGLYECHHIIEERVFQTWDGGASWQLASGDATNCDQYCNGLIFANSSTGFISYDSRHSFGVFYPVINFSFTKDGGENWEMADLPKDTMDSPPNPVLAERIKNVDWSWETSYDHNCGSTGLKKFPDNRIALFASCSFDGGFALDYLAFFRAASDAEQVLYSGISAGADIGDFYGYFGWITNQSEFFYNTQLGWRLYLGAGMDAKGPVYLQCTQDGGDTWETIAPVPWQNAHFQFVDPQNGWALVAFPWGKALVKTIDGGKTWEEIRPVNADLSAITPVPVLPTATSTPPSTGSANWSMVKTGIISSLAIDPVTPTTVYAGILNEGVFKSMDRGKSWSTVNAGLTDTGVSSIAIDPVTPTTLYVGISGSGIFKSMDGGGIWRTANTGLIDHYVRVLAVDPVTPAILYAGAEDGHVYKSIDGGMSWSAIETGTILALNALVVDPRVPTTLYMGSYSVYKSVDSGKSWRFILTETSSVHALVVDPQDPATLYAGTWKGIYKSTDSGANWNALDNGPTNTPILSLAIDPVTPTILYAGTNHSVFKSTDSGESWHSIDAGLPNTYVYVLVVDPADPGILYAGTADGLFVLHQQAE